MALANDIQIEASDNQGNPPPQVYTTAVAGQTHVPAITETITLRKKTPTGSAGSVTVVNGKVTANTKPT